MEVRGSVFGMVLVAGIAGLALMSMAPDKVIKMTEEYCYEFPQEKAYVMTDKANYVGGDTIWFRGFVVDAASHQPVAVSRYLYVELSNPAGDVEKRVMIREKDGVYAGHIPLDTDIADGEYQLSAYTNFMRSQHIDYFPKKSLHINNLVALKNKIVHDWDTSTRQLRLTLIDRATGEETPWAACSLVTDGGKSFTPMTHKSPVTVKIKPEELSRGYIKVTFDGYSSFIKLDDNVGENYDITFHPEGGYLIPGNRCNIAFKAIGKDGYGKDAEGVIVDTLGREVARFATMHAGMGRTSFVPEEGQFYTAVSDDGRRFNLPVPNETAAAIHVVREGADTLYIDLVGNVPSGGQVLVQQRGIVLWSEPIKDCYSFRFASKGALSGIMQVLLLDKDMNKWSERLIFVDNEKVARAEITTDRSRYGNRKIVWASASVDTAKLRGGNFAVSVTDRHSAIIDTMHSIKTQLLLSSDLKGYIENPGFYFSAADSTFRATALDNLMLTQGWKRYDVPAVLKGHKLTPSFPIEKSMSISGTVKSRWREKPLKGVQLGIMSPTTGYGNLTETLNDGTFEFDGFEYPDSAVYYIQAVNQKGGFEDNIKLAETTYPDIPYLTAEPQPHGAERLMDNRMRAELNPVLRGILLSEVTVRARKMRQATVWYEAVSNRQFCPDDPENRYTTGYDEAIRKFPGLLINSDGELIHRGMKVAVYIDGFMIISPQNSMTNSIIPNMPQTNGKMFKGAAAPSGRIAGAIYQTPQVGTATNILNELNMLCPFENVANITFLNSSQAVALGTAAAGGALMVRTRDGRAMESVNDHNPHIAIARPLGYQRPAEFYSPKYEVGDRVDGSDLRSTIYWNPCVRLDRQGKADFEFFTSDNAPTTYTVMLEGITDDGRVITGSAMVEVGR